MNLKSEVTRLAKEVASLERLVSQMGMSNGFIVDPDMDIAYAAEYRIARDRLASARKAYETAYREWEQELDETPMTRPDSIPEWAWAKGLAFAKVIAADVTDSEGRCISRMLVSRIAAHHARALMAEREACAEVAEQHALNPPAGWPHDENGDKEIGWGAGCASVGTAIRNRKD